MVRDFSGACVEFVGGQDRELPAAEVDAFDDARVIHFLAGALVNRL